MITAIINRVQATNFNIEVYYTLSNDLLRDRNIVFPLGTTSEEIRDRIKKDVDLANQYSDEVESLKNELLNEVIE